MVEKLMGIDEVKDYLLESIPVERRRYLQLCEIEKEYDWIQDKRFKDEDGIKVIYFIGICYTIMTILLMLSLEGELTTKITIVTLIMSAFITGVCYSVIIDYLVIKNRLWK